MKDLGGKTAFVTGAASGIGLGIATALAQAGVKVMLCDIEEAALAKAVEGLRQTNADVDGFKADVSLKAELKAGADAAVGRYGEVHILVNNAGVGGGGPYGAWTDGAWEWTLGVNLMGAVWGIEIFGPLMERHGEGGILCPLRRSPGSSHRVAPFNTAYPNTVLSLFLRACAPNLRRVGSACPSYVRDSSIPGSWTPCGTCQDASVASPPTDWRRFERLNHSR
jgi:NAD(P)-dependent dehydrogenase (short-subunit alcohol dehydrogenase family)